MKGKGKYNKKGVSNWSGNKDSKIPCPDSTLVAVNESKTGSDDLPSLGSLESSQGTMHPRAIPIIQSAGGLRHTAQLVQAEFSMAGPSHLAWFSGCLMECPGEGYWLSFDHQLPISYELGDRIYGYLHPGWVLRDDEDAEGEVAEDTIEEEVI